MIMGEYCAQCLLKRRLNAVPASATAQQTAEYQARVRRAVETRGTLSSPEVTSIVSGIYRDLFGPERDWSDVKRRFNALMLGLEPSLQARVDAAKDPLERAIQLAMAGNYIDFAALDSVDERRLRKLLDGAGDIRVDPQTLEALRSELAAARRLVCLTDNCGEIVLDKVLLRTIRGLYPALHTAVIVRGVPVVNDATLEDAAQVNMDEVAGAVLSNGCDLPGTVIERVGGQARRELDAADIILSKGQANYEGLCDCGRNIFYIFMCKCQLFMDRFHVEKYSCVLTREGDLRG